VRFSILPLTGSEAQGKQLVYRFYNLAEKVEPQRQPDGYLMIELHDVPGVEDEELMPPAAAIRARVDFSYRGEDQPANETKEQYWKGIDKEWNDVLERFISKKAALKSDLSHAVSANDSPDVKLRKIYARVQQIRNLSIEGEKTRKEEQHENLKENSSVEDVLKRGHGDELEINMLFVGLARAAGFDATQVYVAPAYLNPFTPQSQEADQLDADIVWVKAGGQEYYLDPGARYFPFGLLPWYKADVQGIRLRKDGPEFITTPAQKSTDAALVRDCELRLNDAGDASGKLRVDFIGQFGSLRREQNRDEDETGRKKELADEIRGWLPAGAGFEVTAISNWEDPREPLRVEGTLTILGATSTVGRRMLVPLTLFHATETGAFKSSKRVNDVYFPFPFEEIDNIKYEAPGGYKIESVPAIPKIDLKAVVYEVSTLQQSNGVEVKRHLSVLGTTYPVKYYQPLRSFFNKVKASDETQFVLQRSESAKVN
jgi:hypothetical protein